MDHSFDFNFTWNNANKKLLLSACIYSLTLLIKDCFNMVSNSLADANNSFLSTNLFNSTFIDINLVLKIIYFLILLFVTGPLTTGIISFNSEMRHSDPTFRNNFSFFMSLKKYFGAVAVAFFFYFISYIFDNVFDYLTSNNLSLLFLFLSACWKIFVLIFMFLMNYIYAFTPEKGALNALKNSFVLSEGYRLKILGRVAAYNIAGFFILLSITFFPDSIVGSIVSVLFTLMINSLFYFFYFRNLTQFAEKILLEKNYIELPEFTEQA